MEMTENALKKICRETGVYNTPHLNDVLYCNFRGFKSIGGLRNFTSLRALFLEGNALTSLDGFQHCQLACLYVQDNKIDTLKGIDKLQSLQVLNISNNELRTLGGVAECPRLNTLLCSGNKLQGANALDELKDCAELTTLDVQFNKLDDPQAVEAVKAVPELCSLYIRNNPMLDSIRGCRKQLIASLPKLTYLDDRPVFEMERACAEAWMQGGAEAEKLAREKVQNGTAAAEKANFDAMQMMRKESFRKKRERLGLPPGDTDPFYDTINPADWKEAEDPLELQQAQSRLEAGLGIRHSANCLPHETCTHQPANANLVKIEEIDEEEALIDSSTVEVATIGMQDHSQHSRPQLKEPKDWSTEYIADEFEGGAGKSNGMHPAHDQNMVSTAAEQILLHESGVASYEGQKDREQTQTVSNATPGSEPTSRQPTLEAMSFLLPTDDPAQTALQQEAPSKASFIEIFENDWQPDNVQQELNDIADSKIGSSNEDAASRLDKYKLHRAV